MDDRVRLLEEERRLANARTRLAKANGNLSENNGILPETYRDWRKVPAAERAQIAQMSTAEIAARYGVDERTARNWRKAAQL